MADKKFLYQAVYAGITEKICDGTLKPFDKLPTDDELSKEYGVSAITVKKALTLLGQNGIINRVQGKGSFVSQVEKSSCQVPGSKIIGVILEHVATPFGLELLYALDNYASESGYKIFVRFSYGNRTRENEEIDYLLSQNVDGLIVMPTHGFHFNTRLLKLILDGFPVVLIDKELKGIPVTTVISDNRAATAMLVEHLASIGKRRIALVTTSDADTSSIADRMQGFYETAEELGLTVLQQCSVRSETHFMSQKPNSPVRDVIESYLRDNMGELDAIVCAEYGFVPDLVNACNGLGIRIPEELTICCIDEDYLAPFGYFFTHAKQDEKEIAKKAVECMLEQIVSGQVQDCVCRIAPVLTIGRSSSNERYQEGICHP